jgi:general secretion pathway protein F
MKQFDVLVLVEGRAERRTIGAIDAAAARDQCAGLGKVLRVKELRELRGLRRRSNGAAAGQHSRSRNSRSRFMLNLFMQELIALLEAGLSIVEAIEALAESAPQQEHRNVLEQLLKALYQGQPLSQAMRMQTAIFPALLVAGVASSEHSGQLAQALRRFHHYQVQIENLKKKVRGALLYPAIVMTAGALILVFLLIFVIPRFATVFDGMKHLNGTAMLMVWWGALVSEHGGALLAGAAAALAVAVAAVHSAAVKAVFWNALWRIRRLRQQRQLFILARFYRTFGLLMMGGMPALDALRLTGELLPPERQADLQQVLRQVAEGRNIAAALADANLTTPVAARLLRVGEQSGDLAGMCERIAQFHDEALARAIDLFSKVFEPVLMLCVGGLIGTIVFLLYMPIFELAENVSS